MNIALLGSSGFVGTTVKKYLQAKDISIFPVSRTNGYDLRLKEDNMRFLEQAKPDVIINCAAHVGSLNYVSQFAADVIFNNAQMILNLYESVREFNTNIKIIQPIANCAYPADMDLYEEENFWNGPVHPSVLSYGSSRRLLVTTSQCYEKQYGIRSVNLLTPNMYGPYDSTDPNKAHALNALISKFIKAIKTSQQQVEIWGTGIAIREWLYAEDFAAIVHQIFSDISNEKYHQQFNVAQQGGLSVKELVDIILEELDYKGSVEYNKNMPDGAPKKVMSKNNFSKIFPGFTFTDFREGIRATARYYESVYPY